MNNKPQDTTGTKDWVRFLPQATGYLMIEGTSNGEHKVIQLDMRDEYTRSSLLSCIMQIAEINTKKVTVGEGNDKHEEFKLELSILPPEKWKGWL